MLIAASLAALGGVLWGFGILGKRLGVQGSTNENKNIRATFTIFVYTLTTLIAPLADFATTDRALIAETFGRKDWVWRIPGILGCGAISGLGGVLGTIAFAWSTGVNSALISMVENGTYTMSGAVLIAIFFRELPRSWSYLAGALIMIGILLANSTSSRRKGGDTDSAGSEASDNEFCCPEADCDESEEDRSADEDGSTSAASNLSPEEAASSAAPVPALNRFSSDLPESQVAPTPLRRRAIVFAILAGVCWGFGPVGKKYGVNHVPEGRKHVWTTCTYLVYMASTTWVPLVKLIFTPSDQRREALQDRNFRWLLLGTMGCGLLSGLGGLISTFAFAQGGDRGPIISMIENGIYTMFGALLITVIFKEWPTKRQMLSAAFVLAGLVVSAGGG